MVYPLPSPVSPQKNCALSIIYPGRAAEDAGFDVDFWDARLDDEGQLDDVVAKADVVAVSSLSGFQLGEAVRIARRCKQRFPDKPIVWGGVHVTFLPLESLQEEFVDFVVLGEGEARFPKLLKAIETGYGFTSIDGVGFKRTSTGYRPNPTDEVVFSKTKEAAVTGLRLRTVGTKKQIIEFHDPDGVYGDVYVRRRGLALDLKSEYVPVVSEKTSRLFKAAAKRNEIILQSSRGCAWSPTSCEFCSVGGQYTQFNANTGKTSSVYRYIPFETWSQEMRSIHGLEPFDFIELEDENSSWFLKDRRYADLLKELKVTYHLHLRSDQLKNEETIRWLAETGCVRIHIGAESGNQDTLNAMRKNESVDDHYAAARLLSKHGIDGVYTWIVGNPGETPAAIMDTLRVSDEVGALHPAGRSRATIYVLMPLPGTLAFERAKSDGWILPDRMDGWTEMSAAHNPKLPAWINNLYMIAGFHHNRYHKTTQNFPGWWRLAILGFEILMEWRWRRGVKTSNPTYFKFFSIERWFIAKLLAWRSKRSVGQGISQIPKLIERFLPGMAGH